MVLYTFIHTCRPTGRCRIFFSQQHLLIYTLLPISPSGTVVAVLRFWPRPQMFQLTYLLIAAAAALIVLAYRRRGYDPSRREHYRVQRRLPVLHHDETAQSSLSTGSRYQSAAAELHDHAGRTRGPAARHRRHQRKVIPHFCLRLCYAKNMHLFIVLTKSL